MGLSLFLADINVGAFQVEQFLLENWQFYLELVLRVFIALLCGAIVGMERSKRLKEAGVRTHAVVAAASAVLMIISKYAFADIILSGLSQDKGYDPSRIASQVITGISFLGAGAIFKNGSVIKGLTTAAGIWATCAIGLAIGSGMYIIGVVLTFALLGIQFIMHKIRVGNDTVGSYSFTFTVYSSQEFRNALKQKFEEWGVIIEEYSVERRNEGLTTYNYTLKIGKNISDEERNDFFDSRSDVVFFNIKRQILNEICKNLLTNHKIGDRLYIILRKARNVMATTIFATAYYYFYFYC